jgi:(p)ppGpp synthase/HD superfamily hydrolase
MDHSGYPYILHPIHLAEQMENEDTCVVAMLHDVVEDTEVSLADLQAAGFTEPQLEAVRLLTHEKGVPYMDYVRNLKDNEIARTVKLADLRHNSDLSRLDIVTEKDRKRYEKYQQAMEILKD